MRPPPTHCIRNHQQRQRGIALYVVIVFVMLSMLLALWAARSSLFNEIVVGNDADYRRTFEAAQAMLQDAEFDIRGVNPDGSKCEYTPGNIDICRPPPPPTTNNTTSTTTTSNGAEVYFDIENKDLEKILSAIEKNQPTAKCFKGICLKRSGAQDFWNDSTTLNNMITENVGARYGQFTGAKSANIANPILANRDPGKGAWYWVEILPYIDSTVSLLSNMPPGSNVERFAPMRSKNFVYRITALARGNKPGSEVVLQSTLSLQVAE